MLALPPRWEHTVKRVGRIIGYRFPNRDGKSRSDCNMFSASHTGCVSISLVRLLLSAGKAAAENYF